MKEVEVILKKWEEGIYTHMVREVGVVLKKWEEGIYTHMVREAGVITDSQEMGGGDLHAYGEGSGSDH